MQSGDGQSVRHEYATKMSRFWINELNFYFSCSGSCRAPGATKTIHVKFERELTFLTQPRFQRVSLFSLYLTFRTLVGFLFQMRIYLPSFTQGCRGLLLLNVVQSRDAGTFLPVHFHISSGTENCWCSRSLIRVG